MELSRSDKLTLAALAVFVLVLLPPMNEFLIPLMRRVSYAVVAALLVFLVLALAKRLFARSA